MSGVNEQTDEKPETDAQVDKSGSDFRSAFREIAIWFERPSSETVLFSGFPDDALTGEDVDDVERLAERIGLDVAPISARSCRGGDFECPAIIRLGDGSVLPLLWADVMGRYVTPAHRMLSIDDLKALAPVGGYSFESHYSNQKETPSVGDAPIIERRNWLRITLAPFWRSYMSVAATALLINLIALGSPLFTMNVYDRVLPNRAIPTLWVLALGIGLAYLFDLTLKTARAELIDHAGRQADLRLSERLFDKVLNTTLASRPMSTGEYASRITQYEFVREFFTSNTISVMIDSVFVFVFLGVIFLIAGWLVVIPTVALMASIAVGIYAQARIGRRVVAAANESARRQALLVETISTLETLKSLRAEATMLKRWRELSLNASRTSEKIKQTSANASHVSGFIQQISRVAIVVAGTYRFEEGDMPMGAIIATVMLAGQAGGPMGQITMTIARFRQALMSLRTISGIMKLEEDRPSTTGFVNREVKEGGFAFDSVSFVYPGSDQPVLVGFTLSVKPGEKVGIIGRIGSGKTTVGRLLGGLYAPAEGRLLIDGVDIRQYHVAEVRRAVSIAGQSSDLFSGTVKENLLLGRADATDEEILSVCSMTGVDQFVAAHPRGFDMPVGERGSNLSTGQKQALTIARLLLSQPKILFLDEPSGAMDLASEKHLIDCLKGALKPETTLVMATHRHSMLELVDRLVVVDKGKVIADGPKQAVIAAMQKQALNGASLEAAKSADKAALPKQRQATLSKLQS
ncbi:type I secretion system permease/ATPase [Rhizobium sp. L1K21]|uniref:type I secretion system permease/ATPase n=1 Tax=Rhizobium sp. L1K21 TaxID=2954933 RepID=UPI0020938A73|nr:type I secretion system permease/ATPase [Rhizobium sp. L1K21]MCO6187038.1 type I secretion system permease/ATPase [Rhizobium sp. L1K21]